MRALLLSIFVSMSLLIGCVDTLPSGNARVPEPAKSVDVSPYLGKWYEHARYENRFEKGCTDVTAEYARLADGKLGVKNSCRKDGKISVADGKAKIVDEVTNAKLKVSFFGPFYFGNYWVLDRADDYSWSIVGEPTGRYLWILTRTAHISPQLSETLVARVAALGYDTSLLHMTVHGDAAQ